MVRFVGGQRQDAVTVRVRLPIEPPEWEELVPDPSGGEGAHCWRPVPKIPVAINPVVPALAPGKREE